MVRDFNKKGEYFHASSGSLHLLLQNSDKSYVDLVFVEFALKSTALTSPTRKFRLISVKCVEGVFPALTVKKGVNKTFYLSHAVQVWIRKYLFSRPNHSELVVSSNTLEMSSSLLISAMMTTETINRLPRCFRNQTQRPVFL